MAKTYCKKYFVMIMDMTNKPYESKSFWSKKFADYWIKKKIAEHEKLFHKQFKAELSRCLY